MNRTYVPLGHSLDKLRLHKIRSIKVSVCFKALVYLNTRSPQPALCSHPSRATTKCCVRKDMSGVASHNGGNERFGNDQPQMGDHDETS